MTIRHLFRRAPAHSHGNAPAFAVRHRAFVANLRRGATTAMSIGGVAQVVRRAPTRAIERLRTLTRFCTRIVERRMPWVAVARAAPQGIPVPGRGVHRYERRTLLTRLIDRRTHSTERSRTKLVERRIGLALRAAAVDRGAMRVAPPLRIEARQAFPPVAQTPARIAAAPKASSDRREAAPQAVAAAAERRAVTRLRGAIATPEALTLPQIELARVTEHVIGELDRRVRSFRERMGRV